MGSTENARLKSYKTETYQPWATPPTTITDVSFSCGVIKQNIELAKIFCLNDIFCDGQSLVEGDLSIKKAAFCQQNLFR
jgi:hypothetical protein